MAEAAFECSSKSADYQQQIYTNGVDIIHNKSTTTINNEINVNKINNSNRKSLKQEDQKICNKTNAIAKKSMDFNNTNEFKTNPEFLYSCINPDGCVTLEDILKSLNAPIQEEHAWALIYQTVQMYRDACEGPGILIRNFKLPAGIENINIHNDGNVHINCDLKGEDSNASVTSQTKILMKLGLVIYTALDYNLQADEECIISPELEKLISHMTTEDVDDQGIERDSEDVDDDKCINTKELDFVLEMCIPRVQSSSVPKDHYKAVCGSLVRKCLELPIFLQKEFHGDTDSLGISADTQTSNKELAKLDVRLKKSNFSRTPVEYELAPYKILMEDIQTKKYNLRKVMVNGDIPPRVRKDDHDLTLEFIRSRPRLKKASERQLPPPIKRTASPREQLMDSIRKGCVLKPTQPCLKNRLLPSGHIENIKKDEQPQKQTWTKNSLDEKQWTDRISDRLSLTLEEIVHIRSVMTKAELDGLPVGIQVKEDVERNKLCFLCLRTRFSIFGPWGIQCKLCQRTVCSKCYSNMRIPTEHFLNVPVVLLSASLMNSPVGSNASSPKHQRSVINTPGSGGQNDISQIQLCHHNKQNLTSDVSTTSNVLGANNHINSNINKISNNKENYFGMLLDMYHLITSLITASWNLACMSRSMEDPKILPVQSPARPHSNSNTLDRKNLFARAFTLSTSAHLGDQKKNTLRGEIMAVCNDCHGLAREIIRSSKQTRSSARNRALKNLTLD